MTDESPAPTRRQIEAGARALLRDAMPTEPGPWWRSDEAYPVRVCYGPPGRLDWRRDYEAACRPVTCDGRWLAPALTPDEADALLRERDEARAEVARLRAAIHAAAEGLGEVKP